MVPRWRFLATFLHPVFSVSHAQHVSDLHSKFALRPHHVFYLPPTYLSTSGMRLALTPKLQSTTALVPVVISRPAEGRRLS